MQIRQLIFPNKTLYTLTQTFRYLNCCCNFFLYSATSSLFRRELREIFQCTNSTMHTQKDTNFNIKQRSRTLSSSPLPAYSTQNDDSHHPSERRNLLSTIARIENSNLTDSTNGHTVSFTA